MNKKINKLSWLLISIGFIILIFTTKYFFFNEWQAFSCKSRKGWCNGRGRYSRKGEYSNYFEKNMRAKEYVIFKYPGKIKQYTFESSDCVER